MKRIFTKFLAVVLSIALSFSFAGCIFGGGWFYDSEEKIARNNIEKLAKCLSDGDSAGVKKLFAVNKVAEAEKFDESLNELLDYYGGEYVSYKGTSGSTGDYYYGRTIKILHMSYDVTTTECVYRFGMDWRIEDDYDKDNIGIWFLYVIKYDDDPFKTYAYWGDGDDTVGINVGKTYKPKHMYNYNWTDGNGKISFSNLTRGVGNGIVTLGGKQIDAEYVFGDGTLSVSVFADDLENYDGASRLGVVTETFDLEQINADQKLLSKNDVVLFGENFGKISLRFSEYSEADFDTKSEWEYYYGWSCHLSVNAGGDCLFELQDVCRGYFKRKCRTAVINPSTENRKVIFKWLPDNRFAFYEYDERGFVDDDAPTLAEGTYEEKFPNYNITFTKNELFHYEDLSGVHMSDNFTEIFLPQ